MADPICRWRNPYFKTVRELIETLPKENLSSSAGRAFTNEKWGNDFFTTPYQLACQTGLYYEYDNNFVVRFHSNPSPHDLKKYLLNWILNYYVPNPYTKQGFANIKPQILHVEFAKKLKEKNGELDWSAVKNEIFGEAIGNDDILINCFNNYSEVLEIKNGKLKLKEGVNYNDLDSYIYDYELGERNDKQAFFEFLNLDEANGNHTGKITATIPQNIIYYGAPGTGKSFKVNEIVKQLSNTFFERVTFHPEYDNALFVGGYKPVSEKDDKKNDIIKYKFVPQAFTNIYERAWKDLDNQYYLIVEEINRGNCAEIFGEIFQLLDRTANYTVSPSKELKEYLTLDAFGDKDHPGIINGLRLPDNLTILATMNTSDQSLFPMDSAFKRRWDWEYMPICYTELHEHSGENKSYKFEIEIEDGNTYSWISFIKLVNIKHIKENPSLGMDKCIGNYFLNADETNKISLKTFINKVIFYLWNDVFKDEDNKFFEDNTTYEDFFPIETSGKLKVQELFERLGLPPVNLVPQDHN